MKKILCFGDSNVYGYTPKDGTRNNDRWCNLLKKLCKNKCEIIEAGCNNRTAISDNPCGIEQTGYKILPSLLSTEYDCVIIAVGVNDLQFAYNISLDALKDGLVNLVKIVQKNLTSAKVILLAPSCLTENVLKSGFRFMFDSSSIEKSKFMPELYENVANECGCFFLNLDSIAKVSKFDGLHYETCEHEKIAQAVFELLVKNILLV